MNAAGLAQRSLAPVKTSAIGHSLAFEEHLTASGVASRTTHLVPPILRVSPAGVACGSYNCQKSTLYKFLEVQRLGLMALPVVARASITTPFACNLSQ